MLCNHFLKERTYSHQFPNDSKARALQSEGTVCHHGDPATDPEGNTSPPFKLNTGCKAGSTLRRYSV